MTSMDRDLALTILKRCFPHADKIRIINNQVEDSQRHGTSDVTRFIVEYQEDHKTRRSHVVMKAPTTGALSSICEKLNVYEKEIKMYEEVIPQLNEYLDKRLAPAHLYTTDTRIVVLEDLTGRGYISGEKLPLLNFAEAKSCMLAFANFHAASHKLHEKDPNILKSLLSSYMDGEGTDFIKLITPWGSVALELLRRKNETYLIPKIEAGILFFQNIKADTMKEVLDKSKFKFVALNHGDGRKDNFLFKHVANNQVQVQFVDYQCCFWSSPAFDIIYFLTNSVSVDVLEGHFDDLIDEYLQELNLRLKKLGCASTYRRADFDEDFKTLKFFLLLSFFTLCGLNSPMNMQELGDILQKPEIDFNYMYNACLNDDQFVRIVYGWLKFFEKSKMADLF